MNNNLFYKMGNELLQEQGMPVVIWHISNQKFKKFDKEMMAQGVAWFAKDKESLLNNRHGASITNQKPIYLYKCVINIDKIANRDEYERYGLSELEQMGYGAINLEGDVAVLNPDNVIIRSVQQIKV